MNRLFFLSIIGFFMLGLTSAEAQKKKTYIKDVVFTFKGTGHVIQEVRENSETGAKSWVSVGQTLDYNKCDVEAGSSEMRATLRANGTRLDVMGLDDVGMYDLLNAEVVKPKQERHLKRTGNPTGKFKTQSGNEYLYLGDFTPTEEIEIKFDIWEDDDMFGSGWSYDGTDDEHEDTVVKASVAQGHIRYVATANGCVEVSYTIYQE